MLREVHSSGLKQHLVNSWAISIVLSAHPLFFPDSSVSTTSGQRKNEISVISVKFLTDNTIRANPVLSPGGFTSHFAVTGNKFTSQITTQHIANPSMKYIFKKYAMAFDVRCAMCDSGEIV